ncbi:MAG: exodeoxyribonuclease III [Oligoflexales bacterium]
MRLVSWNVNGLRSVLKKGFYSSLKELNADILCFQEIKSEPEQVSLELSGYEAFWNPAHKKGYSGTLVLTKEKPKDIILGMVDSTLNTEGRVITLEFPSYFLVNVYTPNSQRGLLRLDYRINTWDKAFHVHLKNLEKKKPVVFCGDLNVAHTEIDLANPKSNIKNAGFTPEERQSFSTILESGYLDTFREFNKAPGNYSWWTYRHNAREKNIGWRIDYVCASRDLKPHLKDANIHTKIAGSDHCPVSLELDLL